MKKLLKKIGFTFMVFSMGGGSLLALKESQEQAPHFLDVSLKEKVGSMIMVGFQGKTPEEESVIQLKKHIDAGKVGGVLLFGYNVENPVQLKKLIDFLKQGAPHLLVAVDQEGGKATRLTPDKNFKVFPLAPIDVAAILTPQQAEHWYGKTARVLKEMGINVNFGGIADLNPKDYLCPVIGEKERSYGTDPHKIELYNKAAIQAYRKEGIAYAIKHYPGHGYAKADSHEGLTDKTGLGVPAEKQIFLDIARKYHPSMIMTAHLMDRNIDPENPATLSKRHLKPLREAFKGVIVSDDLMMGAILAKYAPSEIGGRWSPEKTPIMIKEVAKKAVEAGCDLLVFSNNPLAAPNIQGFEPDPTLGEKIHETLLQLVEEGSLSREKIEESFQRIRNL